VVRNRVRLELKTPNNRGTPFQLRPVAFFADSFQLVEVYLPGGEEFIHLIVYELGEVVGYAFFYFGLLLLGQFPLKHAQHVQLQVVEPDWPGGVLMGRWHDSAR
jgi:hypothetical protein